MTNAEPLGPDPKPCFRHLWVEVKATEAQQKETGFAQYEICPKCNAIRWPEHV